MICYHMATDWAYICKERKIERKFNINILVIIQRNSPNYPKQNLNTNYFDKLEMSTNIYDTFVSV